jgi:hypothetical protein
MSSEHAIVELDAAGLRRFGVTTGLIVATIFGIVIPWLFEHGILIWPWVIAAALIVWGLCAPASLRPVYVIWMKLGLLLNKITSPIILSVIFVVAILPPALIMKLFRRDAMCRRFDDTLNSYRVSSRPITEEDLKRPF